MPFDDSSRELETRREQALAMGGPGKLEKRRESGVLNARERLELLLDPGTFSESGLLATSWRQELRDRSPADGKVVGFGTVDGRDVAVVSNDFTVLGASSSVINGKKIRHVKEMATSRGLPLVLLGESAGARIPDRMGAAGRAILGQDPHEFRRLRETPWATALLGSCYGSSTWYAAMSDLVVMRKGSTMAVAGSRVTSLAIGENIDAEELGGWRVHSEKSGLVDVVVDSDVEAITILKRFLSYMPAHNGEAPPLVSGVVKDQPQCDMSALIPRSRSQVYDVRKIISAIVDENSIFELKSRFGKSLVTSLARIQGSVVGVIANNPLFKGGAIDIHACRKATSFLVLCDSFNIPIVMLVDVPGFLIGMEGEQQGMSGAIINWLNALQLVSVPKITVIMRKSYGQAYLNMGGGRNSDEVVCWPSADLGFMDPGIAVNVVHGIIKDDDPERFETLRDEISRENSAWELAASYEAHDIINPNETRTYLDATLRIHANRRSGGIGRHLLSNWPTSY